MPEVKIKQTAEAAEGAAVVQVAGDYCAGLSIDQTKEIAREVMRTEYGILFDDALQTFQGRATKLTDDIIGKVESTNPLLKQRFKEPSIQLTLNAVLKEYGKTGDPDLGEGLVDLMIEKLTFKDGCIQSHIIDEAIALLPKLNKDHLVFLAMLYRFRNTYNPNLTDLPKFNSYYQQWISLIQPITNIGEDFIKYLKFLRCVQDMSMTKYYKPYEEIIQINYAGLFNKGFNPHEIEPDIMTKLHDAGLIIRCLHNRTKLQINTYNESTLNERLNNFQESDKIQILKIFTDNIIPSTEIKDYLKSQDKRWNDILTFLDNKEFNCYELSSVGKYLGKKYFDKIEKTIIH
jgi:hypothetical protein